MALTLLSPTSIHALLCTDSLGCVLDGLVLKTLFLDYYVIFVEKQSLSGNQLDGIWWGCY